MPWHPAPPPFFLATRRWKASIEVPVIRVADPRHALALVAARYYARQPRTVAAVTGTNGKTSVTVFLRQIWAACNRKAASLGTIGLRRARP